ncbi:MAG: hypothetical protein RLZ98_1690 [Pseudomonadota bacterium]|jgi:DNA-binding MarR family transcriptional regulator
MTTSKVSDESPTERLPTSPRTVNFDELPTYLGYLIRRAHSRIQVEFEQSLAGIGIATSAFGILTLIRANPGITAMDLVAASSLDKSTLSPIIVGLERMGFIRREARASDRRYQSLYFVDEAEPDFEAFREQIRAFEARVEARLTKRDKSELARLLMKLQGLGDVPFALPAGEAVDMRRPRAKGSVRNRRSA